MTNPATDNLRLLVERLPDSGLPNLAPNPTGALGAWGWLSPQSYTGGAIVEASTSPVGIKVIHDSTQSIWRLGTELQPATPGRWYAGRATPLARSYVDLQFKTNLLFYDANRARLDATTGSASAPDGTVAYAPPFTAPAGTAYVALQVWGGGTPQPDFGDWVIFTDAMLTVSDTDPGTAYAFEPAFVGTDILGPAHDLKIEREGLNAGTLDASLSDVDLDPAVSEDLRPGRRVRLEALTAGGAWSPLFVGKIAQAAVTYDLKDHAATEDRHARITLTATDNASALAGESRKAGVGTIGALPWVLEGAGVPWDCNGNTGHVEGATVTSRNGDATALDQVAITRDSVLGLAWVDRRGVLRAYDSDQVPTAAVAVLDEATYSDLDVGFSSDECINEVEVTVLYIANNGDTKEATYGPYTDPESVAKWGRHRATFKVHGIGAYIAAASAFAQSVLLANADPGVRVREVTLPVRTAAEVDLALLDLYDRVQVLHAGKAIDQLRRITALTQEITPTSWHVTAEFDEPSSVAQPQATPAIPSAAFKREDGQAIQAGSVSIATGGAVSADKTVTFPSAFTAAPSVVATTNDGRWLAVVDNITATSARVHCAHRDAAGVAHTVNVHWIAVGPM